MMNNVGELYSLIHFLRIKPYNSFQKFNEDIGQPLKGTSTRGYNQAMKKLQALIKAIMLRRTKKSQIDGKPILTLPEKTIEMQYLNCRSATMQLITLVSSFLVDMTRVRSAS